ncbi:hypothetical protein TRVA0_102S00122 [Trichomonascus vanleenenianus]|uniref:uncharacterized protein n=1 Tax=Trichomonascus vanleenenianus TaxID=2268995 RepID=UPI003ECB78F1
MINFVCCLSIFFFGYDQGMMSGVNNTPDYVRVMGLGETIPPSPENGNMWSVNVTNPTKLGGIVAIYYLGTLIGAVMGGVVGDKWGRVNCVRIACVWVMLGAALQAASQNLAWMLCARVINGIGTGHLNVIVPVWSAETSDFTVRGLAIAFEFTLNIFGVVVAYWLEYGLSYINQGDSVIRWRFPIAFQLVPLILLAILINFMPESPRWLASKDRDDEALEVLARLRSDGDINDPRAMAELQDIKNSVEEEHTNIETSYFAMFFKSQGKIHVSRRVQLVIWFQIVQEWIGIASVTVYQPTIFRQAGFDTQKAGWLSGLNNIFYMFSTLIAVFTIDRWGRRFTSYWGAVGQGIAMFLVGGFSKAAEVTGNPNYGSASAAFVFVFTSVFGATWLVVPWLYQNEIWPVQIRAKGAAWGVIGWSIGNGWLMLLNPVMFASIRERTFYIFGAVNFVAIAMVYCFYPETADRTLEEIEWLFSADTPWNWDAEKAYAEISATHTNLTKTVRTGADIEKLGLHAVHSEKIHEATGATEATAETDDTGLN